MIKLETNVYNTGLKIILEGQNNSFIVYMLDTHHNKMLRTKQYNDYEKALNNYNTRCTGL